MTFVRKQYLSFDFDAEEARLKASKDYSKAEKTRLLKLYSMVKDGDFDGAFHYAHTWKGDQIEYIPCTVWEILTDDYEIEKS